MKNLSYDMEKLNEVYFFEKNYILFKKVAAIKPDDVI